MRDKTSEMKKIIAGILSMFALASCTTAPVRHANVAPYPPPPPRPAPAFQSVAFDDSANVLRVIERVEQVNQPQRECRNEYIETQSQSQERGIGAALIGGVAGGILGHTVGKGNGNTAATAVGAVAGALVGDRLENDSHGGQPSEQAVQRCRTVDHFVSRVNGYEVTYAYQGHEYTTVLPYNPGARINLHVSLHPHL